jgi:hypothetical protein
LWTESSGISNAGGEKLTIQRPTLGGQFIPGAIHPRVRVGSADRAAQARVRQTPEPLAIPTRVNQLWSMGFMQTNEQMDGASESLTL